MKTFYSNLFSILLFTIFHFYESSLYATFPSDVMINVTDSVDSDADGFFSKKTLTFTFNVIPESKVLFSLEFKNADLYEIPLFWLNSDSVSIDSINNSFSFDIFVNENFEPGRYQVEIVITDSHEIIYDEFQYHKLESKMAEDFSTDFYIESSDQDNDGLFGEYTVFYDVNANSGTHDVNGKVYFKFADAFADIFHIDSFQIAGDNTDYRNFSFNPFDYNEVAPFPPTSDNLVIVFFSENKPISTILTRIENYEPRSDDQNIINNVHLSNLIDYDNDSYYSSFDVEFDVSLSPGDYTAVLNVENTGTLTNFTVSENIPQQVTISYTPQQYDFFQCSHCTPDVSIYITDENSTVYTLTSELDPSLKINFEKLQDDSPFHFKSLTYSNLVDNDNDGRPSSGDMHIVFDVNSASDSVYLYGLFMYVPEYFIRFKSDVFKISPTDTTYTYHIRNADLDGARVSLMSSKYNNIFATYDERAFDDVVFETYQSDGVSNNNSITDVSVTDKIDFDKDGYSTAFKVNFKVSSNIGTSGLRAVLSDGTVNVSEILLGENSTLAKLEVNPMTYTPDQNPHSINNYEIKLYYNDSLVAQVNGNEHAALQNIKYESLFEDSPFHIKDIYYSDIVDNDNDGNYSSAVMNVTFDVLSPCTDCVSLWAVYEEALEHVIPFKTDYFRISPIDTFYSYQINDLSIPDGYIQLMSKKFQSFNAYYDRENLNRNFEKMEDDNVITLDSVILTGSIDNDNDGYFSKITFMVILSNYPIAGNIDAGIYFLNEEGSLIDSISINDFKIDTLFSTLPSLEFSLVSNQNHGLYNVSVEVKNSKSGEIKVPLQTVLHNLLLENEEEDRAVSDLINNQENAVKIFPNPVESDLFIYNLNDDEKIIINIYSEEGVLVAKKEYFSHSGTISVSLDNLNRGIYFIGIQLKDNLKYFKLIKK